MEQDYASKILDKDVKKIDKWIAYVATRSWVKSGVYVVAVLESTVVPVLPELVVAAVLSYRKDISWKLMSIISAFGSMTGAAIMYLLGKFLYIKHAYFFETFLGSGLGTYGERLLDHNTFVTIFLSAFTFLPDPIFAFLSGAFLLSFPIVLLAFFLGRLIRVGIVAYFSYEYGDEARGYILKHTRLATGIVVSLAVLYALLKYLGIL
jgi:membrane protein YqaA with SNARE-associated domain